MTIFSCSLPVCSCIVFASRLRLRADNDGDAVVVRPGRFLDARGRQVAECIADLVARARGVRSIHCECLIDEHDRRVFGEERRVAGGVIVGGQYLRGPTGFAQRIADDGETFAWPVRARPFEIGERVCGKAGCEERAHLESVDTDHEDAGEISGRPEAHMMRLALGERFAFGCVAVSDHDRVLRAVLLAVLCGFGDIGAHKRGGVELALEHHAVAEHTEERVERAIGMGVAADVLCCETERCECGADGDFEGVRIDAGGGSRELRDDVGRRGVGAGGLGIGEVVGGVVAAEAAIGILHDDRPQAARDHLLHVCLEGGIDVFLALVLRKEIARNGFGENLIDRPRFTIGENIEGDGDDVGTWLQFEWRDAVACGDRCRHFAAADGCVRCDARKILEADAHDFRCEDVACGEAFGGVLHRPRRPRCHV